MKISVEIPGANITRFREAKSLSQDELADKMDVSRQTVNTWEGKETVKLSDDKAQKMAKVLAVTLKELTTKVATSKDTEKRTGDGYVPEHVLEHYRNTAEHIMNENKELWSLLKELRTKH